MAALETVSEMLVDPDMLRAEAFRFDSSVFAERFQAFVLQALERHQCQYRR